MLEEVRREVESTVAPLIRGILEDSQKLFRQELALAKVEVREDARRARGALIAFSVGGIAALVGVTLLGYTAAQLLHEIFPAIPLWLDFGMVAALVLLVGVGFIVGGQKRAKDIRGIPQQTVEVIRENVEWIQRKL